MVSHRVMVDVPTDLIWFVSRLLAARRRLWVAAAAESPQSTWKKSVASIVAACAFRKLPPRRVRAPLRCRRDLQRPEHPADRGRADPMAELEQLALDPLISPAVVLGGEPLDQRHDLGADRRPASPAGIGPLAGDQAAVPPQGGAGVTSRCTPNRAGRSRICAARIARSAQSGRGRGLVRRSAATSCRSTSSSAFFDADDHRLSRISDPQSRTKMR